MFYRRLIIIKINISFFGQNKEPVSVLKVIHLSRASTCAGVQSFTGEKFILDCLTHACLVVAIILA